jgi:hypothetical protein
MRSYHRQIKPAVKALLMQIKILTIIFIFFQMAFSLTLAPLKLYCDTLTYNICSKQLIIDEREVDIITYDSLNAIINNPKYNKIEITLLDSNIIKNNKYHINNKSIIIKNTDSIPFVNIKSIKLIGKYKYNNLPPYLFGFGLGGLGTLSFCYFVSRANNGEFQSKNIFYLEIPFLLFGFLMVYFDTDYNFILLKP